MSRNFCDDKISNISVDNKAEKPLRVFLEEEYQKRKQEKENLRRTYQERTNSINIEPLKS